MSEESKPSEKVLNETVVKLGLVSLFADIASEMLYPITPIFLTTVLGASMTSVGFIEGFAEAVASLLKVSSGVWSDRLAKRKPFLVSGYFLSALSKPLTGLSGSWPAVFGARAIDRVGKGIRGGPRDALLAESVSADRLGSAFGVHRAMDTLGAAIGPLLAILYLQYRSDDLRGIYFWAVLPGLVSVAFTLSVRDRIRTAEAAAPKSPWSMSDFSPAFWRYLVAWGVFSVVNSSDVFLLMKAKQSGASVTTVILLYCFYNLLYALASPYLGSLSDRLPRKKVLIGGLVLFALVYAGFAHATHTADYWALFGIYGLYMAATDGVGKSLVVDLAPRNRKATGIGLHGTVTGLATIAASVSAGFLWDHVAPAAALYYGSTGAIVAAFLLASGPKRTGV